MENIIEGNPQSVADLAISHPGALAVFTKYNIDFCCGGHRSIAEACRRVGLNPEQIKNEIYNSPVADRSGALRPENWSSTFLIGFIVENHHGYVRSAIPEILTYLEKVCNAHGNECFELLQIRECFEDLSEELTSHMQKEELALFPAIKKLESRYSNDHPQAMNIATPIEVMEQEHELAGSLIKQIRALSDNYTPPHFACPTFKITYKKLQEFENDLMRHIHLENNILFERLKVKKSEHGSCSL